MMLSTVIMLTNTHIYKRTLLELADLATVPLHEGDSAVPRYDAAA